MVCVWVYAGDILVGHVPVRAAAPEVQPSQLQAEVEAPQTLEAPPCMVKHLSPGYQSGIPRSGPHAMCDAGVCSQIIRRDITCQM